MTAPVVILNSATSQRTRSLQAPHPDVVQVDGRDLPQLLAFGESFGELVRFWDINDQEAGNWRPFFSSTPAAHHARHAALDIERTAARLRRLLDDCRRTTEQRHRHQALRALQELVARLLAIFDRDPIIEGEQAQQWQRMLSRTRSDALHAPWRRLQELERQAAHHDTPEADPFHEQCGLLGTVIDLLIDALRQGVATARDAAIMTLQQRGHTPQAALYNAFASLYVESRTELNRFPHRLLRFYHQEVIQQQHVDAQPDHVFLCASLAKDAMQADIARGTLFSAGQDANGSPVQYAADTALSVGVAQVTGLRVHQVRYPQHGSKSPTGVLSGEVAPPLDSLTAFPIFGGSRPGTFGSLTMAPASVGFAITSPVLSLQGGLRDVQIVLTPSLALNGRPAQVQSTTQQVFTLQYSSAGAWIVVQDFTLMPAADGSSSYVLRFQLPPDAPALVALSTRPDSPLPTGIDSLPPDTYPTHPDVPSIVAQWSPPTPSRPEDQDLFAMLTLLELSTASIRVAVSGLPPKALSSPNGALYPGQSMAIFGLKPAQFSALDLQVPELFTKTVSDLSVSITWTGLPVQSTGFLGYYQGYVLNANGQRSLTPLFDNDSFQVAFSVNSPGSWQTSSDIFTLFQTSPSPQGLLPTLQQTSLLDAPGIVSQPLPPYYDPSASSLRLTLAAPTYAFGAALYASNLTAASSANVAALRAGSTATPQPSKATSANARLTQASAMAAQPGGLLKTHRVRSAVGQSVASLTEQAMAALQQAVKQKVSAPADQAAYLSALDSTAAGARTRSSPSWLRWLPHRASAGDMATQVHEWAQAESATLKGTALNQALALLKSAIHLHDTAQVALHGAASTAMSLLDTALQHAQLVVNHTTDATTATIPNAPWLPQASAVTIAYTAEATVQLEALDTDASGPSDQFLHLHPFRQLRPASGALTGVSLLPDIEGYAALYIDLSAPVDAVALLFVLKTDLEVWSGTEPHLIWEQLDQKGHWHRLKVLGDSTHGLLNSGIVSLRLLHHLPTPPRLRVRLISGLNNMPLVLRVSTNAISATWVGPGGADQLGRPLPAGSITQPVQAITGLSGVTQPMPSLGGRARLSGPNFAAWMAERLHHKGYASTEWDYARLCLAAIPMLWQVGVVPTMDARNGDLAPGKVWIIVVAGPESPNIVDPTTPMADASVLGEVNDLLAPLISPFATLQVSNPPYCRIEVHAHVIFTDSDTVDHWVATLQADLVRWLSPWPADDLGPRTDDYYTREAIAEFIRQREYVLGIKHIRIAHDARSVGAVYFTSATQHTLHGSQVQGA